MQNFSTTHIHWSEVGYAKGPELSEEGFRSGIRAAAPSDILEDITG
jgi:hypothetical protein